MAERLVYAFFGNVSVTNFCKYTVAQTYTTLTADNDVANDSCQQDTQHLTSVREVVQMSISAVCRVICGVSGVCCGPNVRCLVATCVQNQCHAVCNV